MLGRVEVEEFLALTRTRIDRWQKFANGSKTMKLLILPFSLLFTLSCVACRPQPRATSTKLTLTMTPVRRTEFGNGTITYAPTPKSGNASCKLVGDKPVTCTEDFTQGETVTLTVRPDQTSTLDSINGCNVTKCEGCPPAVTTCQLTMNGDKSVTAPLIAL